MTRTVDRIYQSSDLNTGARREFIEDAKLGEARLRTPDGEALVMLRAARLGHLSAIRDHALAYLTLDAALTRPRADRRSADFGDWAFIAVFEEDDILEFQAEMNEAIVRAASGQDVSIIESELEAWRMSSRTLNDPVAREILAGAVDESAWVAVETDAEKSI